MSSARISYGFCYTLEAERFLEMRRILELPRLSGQFLLGG